MFELKTKNFKVRDKGMKPSLDSESEKEKEKLLGEGSAYYIYDIEVMR